MLIISKNWSDARLRAHYEKILETNMKIRNRSSFRKTIKYQKQNARFNHLF